MSWDTGKRKREVYAKDGMAFAVYWDNESDWAICWPIKQDRQGEPFRTCAFILELQGWRRIE